MDCALLLLSLWALTGAVSPQEPGKPSDSSRHSHLGGPSLSTTDTWTITKYSFLYSALLLCMLYLNVKMIMSGRGTGQ